MGQKFLGEIPLDTNIRENSDKGTPVVLKDKKFAGIYKEIAERIINVTSLFMVYSFTVLT